ncbi:MAG: AAA family ATPase [Myxococcota bacterium]
MLLELLQRPAPEPLDGGEPPAGHFAVVVAPPFTGKTSYTLHLAAARASGVAPWSGARVIGPGHVLVLAADESAEQVARRVDALGRAFEAGPLEGYAQRVHVLAPDPLLDPGAMLTFNAPGLRALDSILQSASDAGERYVLVIVDAWSDFLPAGVSENDNAEAARIGGALEAMAVRHGPAIIVLHHTGKPGIEGGDRDLRWTPRGASAISAKARTIVAIDSIPEVPHQRRLRMISNLGPAPRPLTLEVADPGDRDGSIVRFVAVDAHEKRDVAPETYLQAGESISTTELARRIAGVEPGTEPGTAAKTRATALRNRWASEDRVRVTNGDRGALMLTLVGAPEVDDVP